VKRKVPTSTSIVFEYLVVADDFRTTQQVKCDTGLDINHVSASLCHLRKRKAIDAIDVDGTLFWYPTPENDDRSKVVLERTPEARPRKRRKRRANLSSVS
jgi:hypothetical protein